MRGVSLFPIDEARSLSTSFTLPFRASGNFQMYSTPKVVLYLVVGCFNMPDLD